MEGKAAHWAAARIRRLNAAQQANTWRGFEQEFKALYCPVTGDRRARAEIQLLKQGNKTVGQYYQEFATLCDDIPDMDEKSKLDWFFKGLSDRLKEKVFPLDPNSLRDAYEQAARWEGMFDLMKPDAPPNKLNVNETATPTETQQILLQLSHVTEVMQRQQEQLTALQQRRNFQQNKMRPRLRCSHHGPGGHTSETCWVLHPELKPTEYPRQPATQSITPQPKK